MVELAGVVARVVEMVVVLGGGDGVKGVHCIQVPSRPFPFPFPLYYHH